MISLFDERGSQVLITIVQHSHQTSQMKPVVPSAPDTAHERRAWLHLTIVQEQKRYSSTVSSTHGLLLLHDIEKSFCAGAWVSVIVLSYAVVDATLRDVTTGDYKASTRDLYGRNPDLEWLRNLRNQIVHVSPPGSASNLWKRVPNELAACHESLEPEARRAVALAYRQVFASGASFERRQR